MPLEGFKEAVRQYHCTAPSFEKEEWKKSVLHTQVVSVIPRWLVGGTE